jgi:hypothetical protein
MTQIDDLIIISGLARYLERLPEERLATIWLELQDEDTETQRLFRAAARAVELHRLAMAPSANIIAV